MWLPALALGTKIAIYCSDVSVAFDKVSAELLLDKLRRSVVHPSIVAVISDWLFGRLGKVVVQGTCSDSFDFKNMTFQGTV